MRRLTLIVAVIASVAIAIIIFGRSSDPEERPAAAAPPVAARPRRDTVVKATGVVKPMIGAEVRVGSRISGVVHRLFVRVGDSVREGQLLAELDDRDLVAQRDQARAALDVAEANLEYARADLARKRRLSAAALLSDSDLDVAQRAFAVAARQAAGGKANLSFAATQLAYARIFAPISGVVASVATQEGETVAASFAAPTFLTLIDLSRLEVWAYVDETDIGRIRIGQRASFTVDTYGDEPFEGVVASIYPKAEIRDNVVDYVAVVRFDPPRGRVLRPDMTTTVRIETEERR